MAFTILVLAISTSAPAEARVRRNFFHEDVNSGVSSHIYKVDDLNPDCTIAREKLKVRTYPEHGSLQLLTGTVKNTCDKAMLQSKCARAVPNGIRAFYRSSAGYKGNDEAVFYALDAGGNALFTTIYLTVR